MSINYYLNCTSELALMTGKTVSECRDALNAKEVEIEKELRDDPDSAMLITLSRVCFGMAPDQFVRTEEDVKETFDGEVMGDMFVDEIP